MKSVSYTHLKALDVLDLSCVKALFLKEKSLQKKHIEKVIEEMTGMSLTTSFSYQNLEEQMKQEIIGQDKAIHTIVESLESLSQYPHPQKPSGIYLLVGGSGIGKTQTAKSLAKLLNRNFVKLDMSEYSEPSSVSKIIGSPPGYVGYDDHSSVLHEIILKPNTILLLDEIEKAHPCLLYT